MSRGVRDCEEVLADVVVHQILSQLPARERNVETTATTLSLSGECLPHHIPPRYAAFALSVGVHPSM